MHSHFLPNLDDGARTIEESLQIILGLVDLGIDAFVATPHFYPGRYMPSDRQIEESLALVQAEMTKIGLKQKIVLGRECFLDVELLTHSNHKNVSFQWNDNWYQLIELHHMAVHGAALEYGAYLQSQGIRPILAHAERYRSTMLDPLSVDDYRSAGFIIQVDIRSFLPGAQKDLRKAAFSLLKKDRIDVIATDIHHSSQLKGLREAFALLKTEVGDEQWRTYFSLA